MHELITLLDTKIPEAMVEDNAIETKVPKLTLRYQH